MAFGRAHGRRPGVRAAPGERRAPIRRLLPHGIDGSVAFNRPPRPAPEPAPAAARRARGRQGGPREPTLPAARDAGADPDLRRHGAAHRQSPLHAVRAAVAGHAARQLGRGAPAAAGASASGRSRSMPPPSPSSARRRRPRAFAADVARARRAHPTLAELIARAHRDRPRLWERRSDHDDAFVLPVGAGRPAVVARASTRRRRRSARPTRSSPSTARSRPSRSSSTCSRARPRHRRRRPAAPAGAGVLLAAATLHGPADLDVVVCADGDRAGGWEWVKWLPHARPPAAPQLFTSADAVAAWAGGGGGAPTSARCARPGRATSPSSSPTAHVVARPDGPAARRARRPDDPGAIRRPHRRRPRPARRVHHVRHASTARARRRSSTCSSGPGSTTCCRTPSTSTWRWRRPGPWRRSTIRRCRTTGGSSLPERVPILDVVGIDEPTVEHVRRRWAEAAGEAPDAAGPRSASRPAGPFVVDLVADGPHGLVAGTTGSGKSELLRSLVVGLAVDAPARRAERRARRLQGRRRVRRLCRPAPHRRVRDRPRRAPRRARAALPARRARPPRAGPPRRRRRRRSTSTVAVAGTTPAAPAARRRRRVRLRSPSSSPSSCRRSSTSPSAGAASGSTSILATQRPAGVVDNKIKANTNLRIALRVQDDGRLGRRRRHAGRGGDPPAHSPAGRSPASAPVSSSSSRSALVTGSAAAAGRPTPLTVRPASWTTARRPRSSGRSPAMPTVPAVRHADPATGPGHRPRAGSSAPIAAARRPAGQSSSAVRTRIRCPSTCRWADLRADERATTSRSRSSTCPTSSARTVRWWRPGPYGS